LRILLSRPFNHTPMLIPNIGLGYLATALRRENHDVMILDCIKEKMGDREFKEFLGSQTFDMIGFQIYTFDVHPFRSFLSTARKANPQAWLVAGGPHPTAEPVEMMTMFPELDALIVSEAEPGLPVLCTLLDKTPRNVDSSHLTLSREELEKVPGMVYRHEDGSMIQNPPQLVQDLDTTGFPAWDLLAPNTYPPAPQGTFTKRLPVAPIIVTRGCPFDCTFCAANIMAGKRLRYRSATLVVDEIELLYEKYGVREIHIEDDNFSLNQKMVQKLCQELIRRNIDVSWACPNGLRLDSLNRELIQLMEKAGCYSIAVGIEAGTQRTLDRMKKRLKLEAVREKLTMIRNSSSLKITGFFMIGYPGETREEIKQTINYSLQLDIDKVNFGAFMPLPGTESYQLLKKEGYLSDLDYSRITEYRTPISFGDISPPQLRRLLQWAFFRFYFRPKIFWRFLKEIHSIHQLKVLGKRFLEVFWK